MTGSEYHGVALAPSRPRRLRRARLVSRIRRDACACDLATAGSRVLVAYLSEFMPTDGAASLLAQSARLDRSPYARRGIARRYVDSGQLDGPQQCGHALQTLIGDARSRRLAVLVESIGRLGPDAATSVKGALALVAAGAEIYEVVGGRVLIGAELAAQLVECGL